MARPQVALKLMEISNRHPSSHDYEFGGHRRAGRRDFY